MAHRRDFVPAFELERVARNIVKDRTIAALAREESLATKPPKLRHVFVPYPLQLGATANDVSGVWLSLFDD